MGRLRGTSSITLLEGMGPSMSVEGSSDTESFGLRALHEGGPGPASGGRADSPHGQPLRAHEQVGEGAHRK